MGTPVSLFNKSDHYDIIEILLKVALNTIDQPRPAKATYSSGRRNLALTDRNNITSTNCVYISPLCWQI